jgi:signal transduction histidine kinase
MNEKLSISYLILSFIIVLFVLLVFFISLILIFAKRLKHKRLQSIDSMFQGAENEKVKIARDLHDHIVPNIAAIIFSLDNIKEGETLEASKQELKTKITSALKEIRAVSHELISHSLEEYGLTEAIEEYLSKSPITFFKTEVNDKDADKRIKPEIAKHLFVIFKELHQNSIKHSGGNEIKIALELQNGCLKFNYTDNGTMQQRSLREGIGLKNIRSRVELINGSLTIGSTSNFQIEIKVNNAV